MVVLHNVQGADFAGQGWEITPPPPTPVSIERNASALA